MEFCGHIFEGPYYDWGGLERRSGIYVVTDLDGGETFVVDVGAGRDVRRDIESHDRKGCWARVIQGVPCLYVRYMESLAEAYEIEQAIRREHTPPCGGE